MSNLIFIFLVLDIALLALDVRHDFRFQRRLERMASELREKI